MDELQKLYMEQIEDYCNVKFDPCKLPAGIQLSLDNLVEIDPMSFNIASEKLSDLAVTYNNSTGDIPAFIRNWLNPYRRLHTVGDKTKREYDDGRR